MADTDDHPGLRLRPVVDWLAGRGVGLEGAVEATLFAGGRSNVTYRLTDGSGRSIVLRRPPLGNVLPTAHDMAREHRVLSGLHQVGFPVPAPLALCEDDEVTGAPFLVMEYVPGRIIGTAAEAAALTDGDRSAASATLVGTLSALHGVDVEAAGLGTLGRPAGYLPRQLARWASQWDLTRTRELATMDRLRTRIEAQLADLTAEPRWSLVHGDYRLDNVILDPSGAQVRAVLDWEMSTLGDPLADLALFLVYWTEAGDGRRHLVPVAEHLTDADGFWGRGRIVEEYSRQTGSSLDHLDVCTALACFKLAVITESIHARTLSGKQLGTAAGDLHAMGVATEALAELGLAVTETGTVAGLSS